MRVSCSYFEGGGADFLARRLVFEPLCGNDPLRGDARMIMIKGNTNSREPPDEIERSDGSFVCEMLENEKAILRINVMRRGANGSLHPEEHVLSLGQALFANTVVSG